MIYRIDIQHFLTHAIDYLTSDELRSGQYLLVSAKIKNLSRADNVVKCPELYPTPEIIEAYAEYQSKDILEKMYFELLAPDKGDKSGWIDNVFYRFIIDPLLSHQNLFILCDEKENDYIDALCKYLKKTFAIEVIDLNVLFSKGRIGPIHIDRDEIHDRAVDIRKVALRNEQRQKSLTQRGRAELMGMMTKKEKLRKLKELGVTVDKNNDNEIDDLLRIEWVNDGEED